MSSVDALDMTGTYDASLSDATEQLSSAKSREQIESIVERLLRSTGEMREANKALEDRLTLSKNEISNLQQSLEAIRTESLTDPLTGLGNRKYFDRMIASAVQNALALRRAAVAAAVRYRPLQVLQRFRMAISPAIRCCGWSACP